MNTEVQNLLHDAHSLLARLKEGPGDTASAAADDALLFCYRLRDGYRIVRSSSKQFRGLTFVSLNDLLYELESRPDETMRSVEWRSVLENLLHALASGAIVVQCNEGSSPRRNTP